MARVLVVDDDNDILKLAERVLGASGHIVFTASDGFRAMAFLETLPFDLLISDANMPHVNGFELVQTVRANPRYQDLSIAMLTGLRERKDIERAVKAGVDDYIVKPIDPLLLVQKVTALFEKKPPVSHPESFFNENDPLSKAHVMSPFTVISVSELGIVVRSPLPLEIGQFLELKSTFFDELGAEVPPLKVLSVEKSDHEGEVRAQLIFLGAREAFLQKIRKYIFTHGTSQRAS
jgi:CheY-like chemotaxis protein